MVMPSIKPVTLTVLLLPPGKGLPDTGSKSTR